jgi:hypothetical protein
VETLDLLSKDKMGENRLNVLWEPHVVDKKIKATLEDLLKNQDSRLVSLLKKKTQGLTH